MAKMIKWFTIYEIEFQGDTLELNILTAETDKQKVYNLIEVKNFEVNSELESELRKDFLTVELKNGTKVNNKKIKIEHLNYKYLVISEYDTNE